MKGLKEVKHIPAEVCFEVRHAGHSTKLSYQQLFADGYVHWLAKRYAEASKVFECSPR